VLVVEAFLAPLWAGWGRVRCLMAPPGSRWAPLAVTGAEVTAVVAEWPDVAA
jgi:hypothetical protein